MVSLYTHSNGNLVKFFWLAPSLVYEKANFAAGYITFIKMMIIFLDFTETL